MSPLLTWEGTGEVPNFCPEGCGGITEEPEKFMDKLHSEARLCVGTLRSEAGIVGAALATAI